MKASVTPRHLLQLSTPRVHCSFQPPLLLTRRRSVAPRPLDRSVAAKQSRQLTADASCLWEPKLPQTSSTTGLVAEGVPLGSGRTTRHLKPFTVQLTESSRITVFYAAPVRRRRVLRRTGVKTEAGTFLDSYLL